MTVGVAGAKVAVGGTGVAAVVGAVVATAAGAAVALGAPWEGLPPAQALTSKIADKLRVTGQCFFIRGLSNPGCDARDTSR